MANDVSIKVASDNSALNSGLGAAKSAVDGFKNHTQTQFAEMGKSFVGLFAFSAVIGGIKGLLDEFGRVQDLADRLGESAETIQRVGYAAKQAGTDTELVVKSLQKATSNAYAALEGNEKLEASFAALGTSAADFVNLSTEDKLAVLATAMEGVTNESPEAQAALDVLGTKSVEMSVLLAQGGDAIKQSMADASVATNEAIADIAAAGDKVDAAFGAIKTAGVTALAQVIDKAQILWGALNTVGTFLGNLPDGFKAAAQAADDFSKDFFANRDAENAPKEKKKAVDTEAVKAKAEAMAKASDEGKKAEDEIAKAIAENKKKEEEAYMRSLTLLEKKVELERQLAELKSRVPASELEAEQNKGKALDMQKELEGVAKEVAREDEKTAKDKADKAKKDARDKAKAEIDARKEELKNAEDGLSSLEQGKGEGFSVDSLRQIGGGLQGVNYNPSVATDDLQKQAVDYQRQTVENLKALLVAAQNKETTVATSDGSFS